MIEFQTYMPFLLTGGETVTVGPNEWRCVFECTLIGVTVEGDIPVLRGPRLNDGSLVLASEYEEPVVKSATVEKTILSKYQQVNLRDTCGKTIKYATGGDVIIIITGDNRYVKLVAYSDPEDCSQWYTEDLSVSDLRTAGLLSNDQWDSILAERKTLQSEYKAHLNEKSFRQLVGSLGRDRVKEILGIS